MMTTKERPKRMVRRQHTRNHALMDSDLYTVFTVTIDGHKAVVRAINEDSLEKYYLRPKMKELGVDMKLKQARKTGVVVYKGTSVKRYLDKHAPDVEVMHGEQLIEANKKSYKGMMSSNDRTRHYSDESEDDAVHEEWLPGMEYKDESVEKEESGEDVDDGEAALKLFKKMRKDDPDLDVFVTKKTKKHKRQKESSDEDEKPPALISEDSDVENANGTKYKQQKITDVLSPRSNGHKSEPVKPVPIVLNDDDAAQEDVLFVPSKSTPVEDEIQWD
jgi:hypothetical protein